jgi:ferredoxin
MASSPDGGDGVTYRIEIDRNTCMGSGVCTVYASSTFDIDDDTKSIVIDPAGDPLEQIEAAAAGCPTGAIKVIRTSP